MGDDFETPFLWRPRSKDVSEVEKEPDVITFAQVVMRLSARRYREMPYHCDNVGKICQELAKVMEYDLIEQLNMYHIGLLHDFGILLCKDFFFGYKGKFLKVVQDPNANDTEKKKATNANNEKENHSELSAAVFLEVNELFKDLTVKGVPLTKFAQFHHLLLNNKGYPPGEENVQELKKHEPLRMLVVADVYEGLRAPRPLYSPSRTRAQALTEMRQNEGLDSVIIDRMEPWLGRIDNKCNNFEYKPESLFRNHPGREI